MSGDFDVIGSLLPPPGELDGTERIEAISGQFAPVAGKPNCSFSLQDIADFVLGQVAGGQTLSALTLSGNSIAENSAPGTIVGAIQNKHIGSTLSLLADAGGRFTISGGNIVAGTPATDYETATSHSITVRETFIAASNSPRDTVLTINVLNLNDTNPNAFSFTDAPNVPLSTIEVSNTITIAGLGASDTAVASISGDVSSQLQKNAGAWGSSAVSVVNGDTLAVRHTSSGSNSTPVDTTLTVGTTSDTFTSTTLASGSGPPTNTATPTIGGINREGESVSIWAGTWSSPPNAFRYTIYRDGALATTITQTDPLATGFGECHFDQPAPARGTVCTAFVEASVNSGGAWSTPVECYYAFYPETQLTEPAVIPIGAVTRTSGVGVLPLTFDYTGVVYPSFQWQIQVFASDYLTVKYTGYKPVTEAELSSPFNVDLLSATNGCTPPLPTLLATDIVRLRLVTQDWMETFYVADQGGKASPWVAVSATDFGGSRFYKFQVDLDASGGVGSGMILTALEASPASGGTDILHDRNYTYTPGSQSISGPGGNTFDSLHMFDNSPSTFGGFGNAVNLPGSVIIDLGIPFPLTELRITDELAYFNTAAPGSFKFGPCDAAGVYASTPVNITGATWSNTVDETKTFFWGAAANRLLRADASGKLLRADGSGYLLRAA